MNTAPTRIWAVDGETPYYYEEGEERPAEVTEYVRIDLHQARIAELETALERWKSIQANEAWEANQVWNAALEAAVDAVQENIFNLRSPDPDGGHVIYARDIIRALKKKEGE